MFIFFGGGAYYLFLNTPLAVGGSALRSLVSMSVCLLWFGLVTCKAQLGE